MKFLVPNFPRKERPMGVYKIVFDNTQFYIGSSLDLRTRFIGWKTRISAGTNKNKKIRELARIVDTIEFIVIELVADAGMLRACESAYIDRYWDDPLLLNYCPNGYSNKGIRWSVEDLKSRVRVVANAKPVALFNDGGFVGRFDFLVDAAKWLNVSVKGLAKHLRGGQGTVKGYTLKLIGEDGDFIDPVPFKSKRQPKKEKIKKPLTPSKQIIKYDLQGNKLAAYDSIGAAAREVGCDKRNFKKGINKSPRGYCAGFVWKYV